MRGLILTALCVLALASVAGPREDGLYISHVHRGGGRLERPDNTLETFLWCWGKTNANNTTNKTESKLNVCYELGTGVK